jgi:hypothetical protein
MVYGLTTVARRRLEWCVKDGEEPASEPTPRRVTDLAKCPGQSRESGAVPEPSADALSGSYSVTARLGIGHGVLRQSLPVR